MEIARRGLLGLGAALALNAAAGCRATDDVPVTGAAPTPTPTPSPSPTPTVPPRPLVPPAPGTMYYGASVPYGISVTDWEDRLGSNLSMHRSYFQTDHDEATQLLRQCRNDVERARLAHVSVKPEHRWSEIAAGERDDWLDSMLRPLGELAAPVIFTLHHEPENDAVGPGMAPSDYVAMQHHLIERAADLAPLVLVAPVLQHWTFDPLREERTDPSVWLVPGAQVVGLDVYNPWSRTNGKAWRSFGNKMDEVLEWFGDTRILIGEYGCREDTELPGRRAEWMSAAAEYGQRHDFVSMSYFNSAVDSTDGTWELSGASEDTFAELLAADWVARV